MNILKARKHYLMILAIMLVVVSLSDTTYSLFFKADSTANFTYNTGVLDLQFTEGEEISIRDAFPMLDSEGVNTKPYVLTVKNTGTLPYVFDLKMLSETDENVIDTRYIKVQVNGMDASSLYANGNMIASNVLLYPDEEKVFEIRVWLDINTPNTELGKTFMAKIVTNGEATYKTLDTSGANRPELSDGMISVYYDEVTKIWKKADNRNIDSLYEWYNYDNQKWANVVTINDSSSMIYDLTRRNNLSLSDVSYNNGNYISKEMYLDLGIVNYDYRNISNIFRVKFNEIDSDKIYFISNDLMSYYYDFNSKRFVFNVGNSYVYSSIYNIDEDSWYVIGYTYDFNIVSFYINGENISSDYISGNISSNSSFKVGTDSSLKVRSNLEIGDIYIYNDILSNDEIRNNYSNTINVIYDNLLYGYNDFIPRTLEEYYLSQDDGFPISYDDISSFYVWIPRFKYKVWNVLGIRDVDSYDAYHNGIDIVFENEMESSGVIYCKNNICYSDPLLITQVTGNDNNKYYTHPAFTVSDKEIRGFWVSKYEVSTLDNNCNGVNLSGCLSNELDVYSKVNNYVWRNNTLSNFYMSVKNYNSDMSIIKNIDWGALTYLTHSKFGLCRTGVCKSIGTNKTFISGNEALDSTTYNNYGVFDMSGSASEFVMGNYGNTKDVMFGSLVVDVNDYDLYYGNSFILGDATKEISLGNGSWYNDYSAYIDDTNNWFIRGGIGVSDDKGIFYYNATRDMNNEYISTRVVIK